MESNLPNLAGNPEEEKSPYQIVFSDGKNKLFKQNIAGQVLEQTGERVESVVAIRAGQSAAVIDTRAYETLKRKCAGDETRFQSYLKAILDFEINHSDDPVRHENRLPIELEIMELLKQEGYNF